MRDYMKRDAVRAEFLCAIGPVLDRDAIRWMKGQRHHLRVTVFEHSLFVAYLAFLMARRWHVGDPGRAARAGFLHDLYLYDPKAKGSHEGTQCFAHPEHALANATRLFPWLTGCERNAIVAHMFPLAKHLPRCRTAWAVSAADKFCAVLEATGLSGAGWCRKRYPDGADLDKIMAMA